MPAALTWLNGVTSSRPIFYLDLTNATEMQVIVTMNGALGATNAKICLRYRSAFSITASDYSVLGASSAEVYGPIGSGGGASTSMATPGSITTIDAAARTTVYVGCLGIDGDGAADPNIGHIMFRYR
jgi:hypothetical protein